MSRRLNGHGQLKRQRLVLPCHSADTDVSNTAPKPSRSVSCIVPIEVPRALSSLQDDPLYQAKAVGRSTDGWVAADHDQVLYGDPDVKG